MLTPPEEVGGMLWHCPTPSDDIDKMADRQEELEGDDVKSVKFASRPATSDGTFSRIKDAVRKFNTPGHADVCKEKGEASRIAEEKEEEGPENNVQEGEGEVLHVYDDDGPGVGEEWLKGAMEVLCKVHPDYWWILGMLLIWAGF